MMASSRRESSRGTLTASRKLESPSSLLSSGVGEEEELVGLVVLVTSVSTEGGVVIGGRGIPAMEGGREGE